MQYPPRGEGEGGGWHSDPMVSVLDCQWNSPSFSPGQVHCVVFLGNTDFTLCFESWRQSQAWCITSLKCRPTTRALKPRNSWDLLSFKYFGNYRMIRLFIQLNVLTVLNCFSNKLFSTWDSKVQILSSRKDCCFSSTLSRVQSLKGFSLFSLVQSALFRWFGGWHWLPALRH